MVSGFQCGGDGKCQGGAGGAGDGVDVDRCLGGGQEGAGAPFQPQLALGGVEADGAVR